MIKQLCIFNNVKGEQCSLGKLAAYTEHAEPWQLPYIICSEENFSELKQYLVSNDNMFTEIVSECFTDILSDSYSVKDLYARHKDLWKPEHTDKLIKEYGASEDMLWLIEQTKDKSSVDEYIKCINTLPLHSSQEYPATCTEYRCIQIAAKVEAISLRSKITIDGTKLTEFASSDIILFKCKNKEQKEICYSIKLSDVLPEDTQCALYGKVSSKFSMINGYDKIFSADSSTQSNVTKQLQSILAKEGVVITPAQYLYILLTRYQYQYSSLSNWDKIIRLNKENESPAKTIAGILDYAYNNGLTEVLIEYKTIWLWRQHVQHKYLFSKDYTLEKEQMYKEVEDWCGFSESKKSFLKRLDTYFDDSAEIKRRKAFKSDSMSTWDTELNTTPTTFLNWVNSIKPVTGENQKKLLLSLCLNKKVVSYNFKQSYSENDYKNAIELSTQKYLSWKRPDGIRIYTLQTEMPYRVLFNNEDILCHGNYGLYHYFPESKHLYIKGEEEKDIAASLALVYPIYGIPFSYEDYVSVCFNSLDEQQQKDKEIKQLKETIERLKKPDDENRKKYEQYFKEYSERVQEFMGADFSMPADRQKAEHIISRYRILMYLKSSGPEYAFKEGFNEYEYIRNDGYAPIPLANGNKHVHPQGAKNGIWFLHPNIWDSIVADGDIGCLCTGNGEKDFKIIKDENDISDIANSHQYAYIRVASTDSMSILDTVKSLFSNHTISEDDDFIFEKVYTNRDVHLMLMVHPTKEPVLNSMFDKVFKSEGDGGFNFTGDEY